MVLLKKATSAVVAVLVLTILVCSNHEVHAFTTTSSFVSRSSMPKVATSSSSSTSLYMAIPVLNKWRVDKAGCVIGLVTGHPVIDDGDRITTSPLSNPNAASEQKIVVTKSGSKYKLGTAQVSFMAKNGNAKASAAAAPAKKTAPRTKPAPKSQPPPVKEKKNDFFAKKKPAPAPSPPPPPKAEPKSEEQMFQQAMKQATTEYNLTGETIANGKYLVAGRSKRSTSGKSDIYTAYRADSSGLPMGQALTIKVSPNRVALQRETKNYQKITSGLTRGMFVNLVEFIDNAGPGKRFNGQCALVIEKGERDVRELLVSRKRGLKGKELRDAAASAAQCLEAVHKSNLVWTDLKAENFVVQEEAGNLLFKGIDLESAMPTKNNPVDYSPEACPPEFAKAYLAGEGLEFILSNRYDIWSYGILLYELSTGKAYFGKKSPSQITQTVRSAGFEVDVSAIQDEKMKDLIQQCCQIEPKKRPSITQVLFHPYFLTTGIGPFSF
mmetsp:Transcript_20023/g.27821  ORF Transcript_20023/g.27821 Transcript_20023/m.27821 type:complete len:495 (-) Transcript_20023:113-1597(-)